MDISWFQQDGPTWHRAIETIDLLNGQFGDTVISRNGFLWAYVEFMFYADKPTTLETLEVNINRVINEARSEVFQKVVYNWTDQMRFVTISRGGYVPRIIFKT